jgi:response regulator RpfG family c-di-GMP phosphodiesterase
MPSSTAQDQPPETITILLVDDEINILQSIKRLLHKYDYKLLLAESGELGMDFLMQEKVDLVISDMRMPGMSGADFLANVASQTPDSYRILLTGFADMDSTIAAINKGKINRYIAKPWNNDELLSAINEGVENVKLKRKNQRLESLLRKQNILLKELNQNLDHKIHLRTKQIRTALSRIEHEHNETLQVLYNFISINPRLDGNFGKSVCQLAKQIATKLDLPAKEIRDIRLASMLCEIGLLGIHSESFTKPFIDLNYEQQQEFLSQTTMASKILSPATHLHNVVEIIASQFEYFNGSGFPDKLVEQQIPIGARILCVARDFWRYTQGRITPLTLDDKHAYIELKKHSGIRYDPIIVDVLLNNKDMITTGFMGPPIAVEALKPGMQLKHNLYTDKHILILPEAHLFTEITIEKLQKMQKLQKTKIMLEIVEIDV